MGVVRVTPEQEKRLEEMRSAFDCLRWLNSPSWKMAEDLLAMVDSLRGECESLRLLHSSALADCFAREAERDSLREELEAHEDCARRSAFEFIKEERDSLRTQVEGLREAREKTVTKVSYGPGGELWCNECGEIPACRCKQDFRGTPYKTEET